LAREQSKGIVVVGGGPAGLSAAFWLRRHGHTVTVIERSDYTDVRIGEHVSPSAMLHLQRFALASGLSLTGHPTSSGVDAYWGSDAPSYSDYFVLPAQQGVNLSRPRFDAELARACEDRCVRVLRSSSIKRAKRGKADWKLDVCVNGSVATLDTSFVVDASGRAAGFARRHGAKLQADDNLIALAAFGRRARVKRSTRSLIESSEHGWWYHAPIDVKRALCIYFVDGDLLPRMPSSPLFDWWHEYLGRTKHISSSVRDCEMSGPLHIRSARSQRLVPLYGEGWMAIGDAATAFDPLSSRGIAKGLAQGERAASTISRFLSGDHSALRQFASEILDDYLAYLNLRKGYYGLETRWPDSVFWRRFNNG
jgi:flavin-dependent dehydrogenase